MRRIGHRGAKGHAPDNTIESFEKALALGCDEVETDVWLADDGRLLITHDRPGPDTKLTLEEVLDFCRGKMPDWSIPDRVVVADSIPHGATGKILKTELRKIYAAPQG